MEGTIKDDAANANQVDDLELSYSSDPTNANILAFTGPGSSSSSIISDDGDDDATTEDRTSVFMEFHVTDAIMRKDLTPRYTVIQDEGGHVIKKVSISSRYLRTCLQRHFKTFVRHSCKKRADHSLTLLEFLSKERVLELGQTPKYQRDVIQPVKGVVATSGVLIKRELPIIGNDDELTLSGSEYWTSESEDDTSSNSSEDEEDDDEQQYEYELMEPEAEELITTKTK